jgi:hypothetical protein
VSQITSVSGGSIFAAHLVLNWGRYNGSPEEFEAAASELIAFVRLDVRNRIVRRFPLTLPLRWLRRPLGLPTRRAYPFSLRGGVLQRVDVPGACIWLCHTQREQSAPRDDAGILRMAGPLA